MAPGLVAPADDLARPVIAPSVALGSVVEPHDFVGRGWRFWICDHCYAPRSLHPRTLWVKARAPGENRYLSVDAPHFREGW